MELDDEAPPIRPFVEQLGEKVGAVVLIVVVVVGLSLALNQSRPLDLDYMARAFPLLSGTAYPWYVFEAAKLTILITVLAYLCGMGIGFLMGWMRTSKGRARKGVATVWVEAIRGTPLFVQLLFLFSVLSFYVPRMESRLVFTGFLALMLNTSAYQAEIFRAGLQSVGAGQVEAAKSIGLGYWGAMRTVILPQAIRLVVPPLMNEFIALLKASSLLFAIGVHELTYQGRLLTFAGNLLEVYVMVIALYLLMTVPLSKLVATLERRFRIPGLGLQQEVRERRGRPAASVVARVLGVNTSRSHTAAGSPPRARREPGAVD